MKRTIRVYDIDWDTDDDSPEELGLPKKTETDTEAVGYDVDEEGWNEDFDISICDWLSDTYGFCVNGFRFRVVGLSRKKAQANSGRTAV